MLTLEAQKRDIFGKKLKEARQEGELPVVVYGHNEKGSSFFVKAADFKKVWRQAGESGIVGLETPDGKKEVLIHEVAFHPLTEEPLHVDFYAVDTTKVTRIKVPLVFEGVAPAVKNLGGILVKVMHEIEVEALPRDLPREIKVDLSPLAAFGSLIKIADLKLPAGVKAVGNSEEIMVSVAEPKEEEVVEAPIDISAVEVEKKGKVEEEGEAAAPKEEVKETKGGKEAKEAKEAKAVKGIKK